MSKYQQRIEDRFGKLYTEIDSRNINTDSMINFIGADVFDGSTEINNNFISLIQQFAGSIPPNNPLEGQVWFNIQSKRRFIWYNDNWIQLDKEPIFDIMMFNQLGIQKQKNDTLVLSSLNFNLTLHNTELFNLDTMDTISYVIDSFDKRKIIFKESVNNILILVYHPDDYISNNKINSTNQFNALSGQNQFDISEMRHQFDLNTFNVMVNSYTLSSYDFTVHNDILNISGKYIINKSDEITISKFGMGNSYYTNIILQYNKRTSHIKIPKVYKELINYTIIDTINKTEVHPSKVIEYTDYLDLFFLDSKLLHIKLYVRII